MRQSFVTSPALLVLVAALVGCDSPTDGVVKGHVTYQQKPVEAGIVNFYAEEKGIAAQADLDATGAFAMTAALPAGTYKVSVMPPMVEQLPPGSPRPAPKPFAVPPKYQDAGKTPMTREVKVGDNDFAIDLTE